jgi:hypothetical protein
MIWVIGGIIFGAVFIIEYGYDMEYILAVLAWVVLPPVGLRIAFHIGQWIYEGFKGSGPVMSAVLSSQGSATQIEEGGKVEDYEAASLESTRDSDNIKGSFSEIELDTPSQHWLIELYERKRMYVHLLPLLLVIINMVTFLSPTTLNYRYEPGDSELLRELIITGMLVPPLALTAYVCLVYIYLGYSAFKGRLPKFYFVMVFLLPTVGIFAAAANILYEMAGRFDFGLFVLAAENDVLFQILAEGAGMAGIPIAVIHLAIFSLFEKKRNPESMANVLMGWSLVFLVLIGLSYAY